VKPTGGVVRKHTSDSNVKGLFDNQRAFETVKGMGVGRDTIKSFLGGHWKGWVIQDH